MFTFTQILSALTPIFIIIAIGALLRKINWFTHNTEENLFKVAINIFAPCLIFESILGRELIRNPRTLLLIFSISIGVWILGYLFFWFVAKILKLPHTHQRSFAFASASANTGFIGIPLVMGLFDKEMLGVYFIYCAGSDMTYWALASSVSEKYSKIEWRKVLNAPFVSIVLATILNFFYQPHWMPAFVAQTIHTLGSCYIPIAVLLIGSLGMELFSQNHAKPKLLHIFGIILTRIILYPLLLIALAYALPISNELKICLIIFGILPAALSAFMVVKYYKGNAQIAFAVTFTTTILSIVTTPLWLKFGLSMIHYNV